MFDRNSPEFTVAKYTFLFTVVATLVGGGYKYGYDNGIRESEIYKTFKEFQLREFLLKLESAASLLSSNADKIVGSEKCKSDLGQQVALNKDLNNKLNEIQAKNTELSNRINEYKEKYDLLFGAKEENYKIVRGEAVRVIPRILNITFDTNTTTFARLRINNETVDMNVGETTYRKIDSKKCGIELLRSDIMANTVEVAVYCGG